MGVNDSAYYTFTFNGYDDPVEDIYTMEDGEPLNEG